MDSIFKTTLQADVPGPKSWGLGPNTVLWGAILVLGSKQVIFTNETKITIVTKGLGREKIHLICIS